MSIANNALLVSLTVQKPQMTAKDVKGTSAAEAANNAHGAGQFRKDLYPKALIQPILTVESSARSYIESTTYAWARGEFLLPTTRFMDFANRMGQYELEFSQAVTAFLNNWSNVMLEAQVRQGAMFNPGDYPDLSDLRADFRFRVSYRPVTDTGDFRVQMQEEELELLRQKAEASVKESMDAMLRTPLLRLRAVVSKLQEVTSKPEREVPNPKTGALEMKPPIFRDSVVENIADEINLLHDFAACLPEQMVTIANDLRDATPSADTLRNDPDKRRETCDTASALLAAINDMLND